jgi:hypothetical protein
MFSRHCLENSVPESAGPRPESETLIETSFKYSRIHGFQGVDAILWTFTGKPSRDRVSPVVLCYPCNLCHCHFCKFIRREWAFPQSRFRNSELYGAGGGRLVAALDTEKTPIPGSSV